MAQRFRQRQGKIDCIISSPATRARSTASLMAEQLKFPVADIISNPELYFAGTAMFLKSASQVDDSCQTAMLVGHNPAITEFANMMANSEIDNIPTCGLVELSLPIQHWSEVCGGEASLLEFDYPKKQESG